MLDQNLAGVDEGIQPGWAGQVRLAGPSAAAALAGVVENLERP